MPMPIREYKRLWCKQCQEWQLFEFNADELICCECKNTHQKTLLNDLPEEKIAEQRNRYIDSKKKSMNELMKEIFMTPEARYIKEFAHMFSKPGTEISIIESDAGQSIIDEEKRRKRIEEIQKIEEEKEIVKRFIFKYKSFQRNDLCPCGSGKKFKKCCLKETLDLSKKYNL